MGATRASRDMLSARCYAVQRFGVVSWMAQIGMPERQAHWQNVYATRGERDLSWFQENPTISLEFIRATGVSIKAPVIDVGGGASRLADALLAQDFQSVTVLDVSERALAASRHRLERRAEAVTWIVADVTEWRPDQSYEVWHDRAAFHFLTDPRDRAGYAACVRSAVPPGGHVIIGTFAPDGPERCSGLPVVRHDAASIGAVLGPAFKLMESRRHDHLTPGGTLQRFQFSRFRKQAAS